MLDTSSFSRRTICFPYKDKKILLGMKLEGFGSENITALAENLMSRKEIQS
ncbi:MAG: hypothetical protein ACP5OA_04970 [Candidatus Woesearchaeota archaeon]